MVFLRGRLDDNAAAGVISQLLLLGQMDAGGAIDLYVDSPGGSLAASLAVYDILRTLSAPVSTTCLATAAGAAVLIVAAGTAGRRFALPHARLHLSEETQDVRPGDVASQANELAGLRVRWRTALVEHIGHSSAQVERDLKSGRWLSAAEARDYGLVDGIIPGAPTT
jgi:ATP-dependent Clp protease protease subunit